MNGQKKQVPGGFWTYSQADGLSTSYPKNIRGITFEADQPQRLLCHDDQVAGGYARGVSRRWKQ